MMAVAMNEGRAVGRRANLAMARAIGKPRLDAWDRMAPAPTLPAEPTDETAENPLPDLLKFL